MVEAISLDLVAQLCPIFCRRDKDASEEFFDTVRLRYKFTRQVFVKRDVPLRNAVVSPFSISA